MSSVRQKWKIVLGLNHNDVSGCMYTWHNQDIIIQSTHIPDYIYSEINYKITPSTIIQV
jgi:hypothetical protein